MSKESNEIYEFGPFRLDVGEHVFQRLDGDPANSLPEKAFRTLLELVRRPGSLVTKTELLDAVWPDAIVEENNLDKAIHLIRHALGEKAPDIKYIETVRKHGYRFTAPVKRIEVSENQDQRPAEEASSDQALKDGKAISGLVKSSPLTDSGQHALVDLSAWRTLVEEFETSSKLRVDETGVPDRDVSAEIVRPAAVEPTAADKEIPFDEVSRSVSRPYILWATAAVILVGAALAALVGFKLWQVPTKSYGGEVSQKRLTVGGGATRVAVSPDGKYAGVAQNGALVLFDLVAGDSRIVVPASKDVRIMTISFQPDTQNIYYGTRQIDQSLVSLYSLPIAGGEPARIIDDIYGSIAFSPDGKRFAFVRRYQESNEYALLVANSDGSDPSKLASSQLPNRFDATPTWSSDSTKIACSTINVDRGFHFTVAKIDTASGSVELVPGQRWKSIGSLSWIADSPDLLVAGQDERSVNTQLWRMNSETGEVGRITDDSFVYESMGATPDGGSIVSVKVRQTSHVWILGEQSLQLTAGFDNYDGFNGLAWGADRTVFYHSRAGGRESIWRMRDDGSEAREVVPDEGGGFAVSPDGRLLVFQDKQTADHLGLQVLDLTNGTARALTQNVTALHPAFFPDGKRLAFTLYDQKLALFETSLDGVKPTVLSSEFRAASTPAVSPSGKLVAFAINRVQNGSIQSGIAVINGDTRAMVSSHIVRISLGSQYEKSTLQWSADETEIYFIELDNSVSNIRKLRLSDGTVSNLTNFADGRIFNFAVEPGGNRILVARGIVERDATLLQVDKPM